MADRPMAMAVFRETMAAVDTATLKAALEARFPGDGDWQVMSRPDLGGAMLVAHAGTVCVVAAVDAPLPAADVVAYAEAAYWWPTARQELAKHKAHCVVSTLAEPEGGVAAALLASRTVLRVAAVLLSQAGSNAIAGIWTNSSVARGAGDFIQQSSDDLPFSLWVDIRLMRGSRHNEVGITTRGLSLLTGVELSLQPTAVLTPDRLAQRCIDIATHMLRGADLRDGDSIAGGDGWQWRVRHRAQGLTGRPTLELAVESPTPAGAA